MKTRKVAVIGLGHVGAHVAYSLAVQGICDELLLIDQNDTKVVCECQDIRDAVVYLPHRISVNVGQFSDLEDVDLIINCVGKISILSETHDRVQEMDFNIKAVRSFAYKIKESGFHGILINISNPCDIITNEVAKILELPEGHVFGTGTGLDTSRLVSHISDATGIDQNSINAYMIGEHGNLQFCPWSTVTFSGVPLDRLADKYEEFRFDRDSITEKSAQGAWAIFQGKNCTEYAIASTAARMASIIFHDGKRIMPASAMLNGEYGEEGLFMGVPCVIGKNGVEKVLELPLNEQEKEHFHQCCQGMRENMKHIADIK